MDPLIRFICKGEYRPSLRRFRQGKRKESKLGNDLNSPASVDVPKHIVIVMDGLKEFTTQLLEWVLENISARGHIITLLGFMPWLNIPLSSKTWQDVWMLEFEHLSLIKERNECKNEAKYLKLQAVLELCRDHGVLDLNSSLCFSFSFTCTVYDNNCIQQVTLQKEIVMGYPLPLLVVERIISHRATWVVFDNDRYLRKNTAYFANKIPCNTVMMSEKGEMDMIKGRPMIDNGDNTPGESPASVPTPLLICSEPLRRILEEQELQLYDAD
ncbi:hypothetical protein V6N13_142126 [Hibiscus sabdariffa]|uniref:Uncharacterized protein n=1 Tax=Hibiscus sabdariffa TaxID=183260 RepID=A0ABR2FDA5_9ROSI